MAVSTGRNARQLCQSGPEPRESRCSSTWPRTSRDGRRRGQGAAAGLYRNEQIITTGEPRFPSVTLPVVVSVCKSAKVVPDAVDFGRFAGQVGRELTLTLAKDCSLKAATAKPDVMAIQIEPADAQGNTKVKLTVKPDAPFGPFHGELLLQLDGPEKAEIAVPFTGYRESPPAFWAGGSFFGRCVTRRSNLCDWPSR